MARHRFRDTMKSLFKGHIDPEREEQLKGTRTDIEEKVKKMLKLVRNEDPEEEDAIHLGDSRREPLAQLIEDFHQKYQSLYDQYNHLTAQLREKVHGKQGRDTASSSSSDSDSELDSDDSPKNKGSKNGKLDGDLQKRAVEMHEELRNASLEIVGLKRKLSAVTGEKEELESEYKTALSKIQDAEENLCELNAKVLLLNAENTEQNVEHKRLAEQLKVMDQVKAELKQRLEDVTGQKETLNLEKESALKRLEEEEKGSSDLKNLFNRTKDDKAAIESELEAVKSEVSSMKRQKELTEQRITKLRHNLESTMEENKSLTSKVYELLSQIEEWQRMVQDIMGESEQLKQTLGEKEREFFALSEIQEVHKKSVLQESERLKAQIESLGLELESLCTKKGIMEEKIESRANEMEYVMGEHMALKEQAAELEKLLKDREDEISSLRMHLRNSEDESLSRMEDLKIQVNNLHLNLHSWEALKAKLEGQIASKNEEASAHLSSLTDQVTELQQELKSLKTHKVELETRLEERSQEVSVYRIETEKLKEELARKTVDQELTLREKESLMAALRDLELEADNMRKDKTKMEQQLQATNNSHDLLSAEHEGLQMKVCELQKSLHSFKGHKTDLELQLESKFRDVSDFSIQIEQLKQQLATAAEYHQKLMEERDGMTAQIEELLAEVDSLINRRNILEGEIQNKSHETEQLHEENNMLQDRVLHFEKSLAEKEEELYIIRGQLEYGENVASTQIMDLEAQVQNLKQDIESRQAEKSQLELQLEQERRDSSERLMQIENLKNEARNQIEQHQNLLKQQEIEHSKLTEEFKLIEGLFQQEKETLKQAESRIKEIEFEFHTKIGSRDQTVAYLEEMVEDLRRDLELKGDEISSLTENVSTIEVKHRLSNQKLRVTEQLLNEKEENFRIREAKFQQEQRVLEEKITTSLEKVVTYQKLITNISEEVNSCFTGLEEALLKFDTEYNNYLSRILYVTSDLQVVRKWAREENDEKHQLKLEIGELAEQFKCEKAQRSVLRDRVEKLKVKVGEEEDAKDRLSAALDTIEKKAGEFEVKLKEKEEGIHDLGEEKREAIRQLCIWIDHHRSRYDDIKEILTKTRGARGQRGNS